MENWTVKTEADAAPQVEEQKSAQEVEQAIVEEAVADTPNVEIEGSDDVVKVNLDQPPVKQEENEQQVSNEQQDEQIEQVESKTEGAETSESPLERITEEEPQKEDLKEEVTASAETVDAIHEASQDPKIELPENVEKLVQFMEETGGSVEDYVNLNRDITKLDDVDVIREHYKQKFPHLDDEDISFKMDEAFLYDEDVDDDRAIRSKKLAFKEELYNAKKALEGNKEKYYADLKLRKQTDIPQEYQQAYEAANNYKQAEEANSKLQAKFIEETGKVFSEDFKGFDFKVGDAKYRYKVNEPAKVKEYQSDINNFIGEFLGEDGSIQDAAGYHKAIYAAKNVDKIANHFYEQGRAEALKQQAKDAKNINMDPRSDMSASVTTKSGTKVRVVNNDAFGSKLKFKNYNNR